MKKPKKPYHDFPLFAHPNGQWAKKIRGRPHYFGVWAKPQAALEKYQKERDYLYAGQAPPDECETLAEVLEAFKADKQRCLDEGDINERTFGDYRAICAAIARLGKHRPIKGIGKADLLKLRERLSKGKNGRQLSPVTFGVKLDVRPHVFQVRQRGTRRGYQVHETAYLPCQETIARRAQSGCQETVHC